MANPKHVVKLMQGADTWNMWREANPDVQPDLSDFEFLDIFDSEAFPRKSPSAKPSLMFADLSGSILSGANFSGVELIYADLSKSLLIKTLFYETVLYAANFSNTDCTEADFSKANLSEASIHNACFRGANLSECNLFRTFFKHADLSKTFLDKTNFNRTKLVDVNFTGADFSNTVLANVDLRETRGLEKTIHSIFSPVSTSTLYRSRGRIPKAFLKGCGLDDIFINYIPDLIAAAEPIQFHSCFISYNHNDEAFVARLHKDLTAHGVDCWYAPQNMRTGDEILPTVFSAIQSHDKLMVVLSPNSAESRWVEDEVEEALVQEKIEGVQKLFPVSLTPQMELPNVPWLQRLIRRRHFCDFSEHGDDTAYEQALERLLRDLNSSAESEEKKQNPAERGNTVS